MNKNYSSSQRSEELPLPKQDQGPLELNDLQAQSSKVSALCTSQFCIKQERSTVKNKPEPTVFAILKAQKVYIIH